MRVWHAWLYSFGSEIIHRVGSLWASFPQDEPKVCIKLASLGVCPSMSMGWPSPRHGYTQSSCILRWTHMDLGGMEGAVALQMGCTRSLAAVVLMAACSSFLSSSFIGGVGRVGENRLGKQGPGGSDGAGGTTVGIAACQPQHPCSSGTPGNHLHLPSGGGAEPASPPQISINFPSHPWPA